MKMNSVGKEVVGGGGRQQVLGQTQVGLKYLVFLSVSGSQTTNQKVKNNK